MCPLKQEMQRQTSGVSRSETTRSVRSAGHWFASQGRELQTLGSEIHAKEIDCRNSSH